MNTYEKVLTGRFKKLAINLVRHDTSPTGLPCYIEVHLGAVPKDRGAMVIDLGNYIYRILGLRYQLIPEFRGRGKATTLRWFMSWEDVAPIADGIKKAFNSKIKDPRHLPVEFYTLIIQKQGKKRSPRKAKV